MIIPTKYRQMHLEPVLNVICSRKNISQKEGIDFLGKWLSKVGPVITLISADGRLCGIFLFQGKEVKEQYLLRGSYLPKNGEFNRKLMMCLA